MAQQALLQMSRHKLSTVVFGLIWTDKLPPTAVPSAWLTNPYDKAVEWLQRPNIKKEDISMVLDGTYLAEAFGAVQHMNGASEGIEWVKMLSRVWHREQTGKKLRHVADGLVMNEDVDVIEAYTELSEIINGDKETGLVQASTIDYSHYKPFMLSGCPYIDEIVGGIPTDGPIITYGPTGVGKSHWAASMVDYYLAQWANKNAAIYTLEMNAQHYLDREIHMYPRLKNNLSRLMVSSTVRTPEEMMAEVMTHNLDLVVLDDMDNMVTESSAAQYEHVYRIVKTIVRLKGIPFIVLAQPNRGGKMAGKFLTLYDVAWSGAAENSAALFIALQDVASTDYGWNDPTYPVTESRHFYMQFLKSRDGWPKQHGPGAIILEPSNTMWRGELLNGEKKLHPRRASSGAQGKPQAQQS